MGPFSCLPPPSLVNFHQPGAPLELTDVSDRSASGDSPSNEDGMPARWRPGSSPEGAQMDIQPSEEIVTLELPRSKAEILLHLADDLALAQHLGHHIRILFLAIGWALGGAAAFVAVWQYIHGEK